MADVVTCPVPCTCGSLLPGPALAQCLPQPAVRLLVGRKSLMRKVTRAVSFPLEFGQVGRTVFPPLQNPARQALSQLSGLPEPTCPCLYVIRRKRAPLPQADLPQVLSGIKSAKLFSKFLTEVSAHSDRSYFVSCAVYTTEIKQRVSKHSIASFSASSSQAGVLGMHDTIEGASTRPASGRHCR